MKGICRSRLNIAPVLRQREELLPAQAAVLLPIVGKQRFLEPKGHIQHQLPHLLIGKRVHIVFLIRKGGVHQSMFAADALKQGITRPRVGEQEVQYPQHPCFTGKFRNRNTLKLFRWAIAHIPSTAEPLAKALSGTVHQSTPLFLIQLCVCSSVGRGYGNGSLRQTHFIIFQNHSKDILKRFQP